MSEDKIVANNGKQLGGITGKGWLPGQSGNPSGRPANSLKDYVARKLAALSDEEKEEWLKTHNIAGELQWRMGEGNPATNTDITSGGKPIVIPSEIIKQNEPDPSTSDNRE